MLPIFSKEDISYKNISIVKDIDADTLKSGYKPQLLVILSTSSTLLPLKRQYQYLRLQYSYPHRVRKDINPEGQSFFVHVKANNHRLYRLSSFGSVMKPVYSNRVGLILQPSPQIYL